ncbi:hypothetical protein BKA69DRAFT_151658 [Paraphysoderma sedebokerense]|nr:hypothetical protein BKA69DRAFT_151658 [Paraphysoderma sedebokerense]
MTRRKIHHLAAIVGLMGNRKDSYLQSIANNFSCHRSLLRDAELCNTPFELEDLRRLLRI